MNDLEGHSLSSLRSKSRFCALSKILLYALRVKEFSIDTIAEYCDVKEGEVIDWINGKAINSKKLSGILLYFDPTNNPIIWDDLLRITKNDYFENNVDLDSESALKEVNYTKQINEIWKHYLKLRGGGYKSFDQDYESICSDLQSFIIKQTLSGKDTFIYVIPPIGHLSVSKSLRMNDQEVEISKKFKIENKSYELACVWVKEYLESADLVISSFDYASRFLGFGSDDESTLSFADNQNNLIFNKLTDTQLKNLKALEIALVYPDTIPIYPEHIFNSFLLSWIQSEGKETLRKAVKRIINDQKLAKKSTQFIVNEIRPELWDHGLYVDSENDFLTLQFPHLYCEVSVNELALVFETLGYKVEIQDLPKNFDKYFVEEDFLLEKKILQVKMPSDIS
jgi:hypothetical protein